MMDPPPGQLAGGEPYGLPLRPEGVGALTTAGDDNYQSSSGLGMSGFAARWFDFFFSPAPAADNSLSASSLLIWPGFGPLPCSRAPSLFCLSLFPWPCFCSCLPWPCPDFGGGGLLSALRAIPKLYLASSSRGLARRLSL